MLKLIKIQTVWSAGLALLVVVAGSASADDQTAPTPSPTPNQVTVQPMATTPVSTSVPMTDDDCECGGLSNCWLIRRIRIHQHDKCMFHWYIRGNGPAIHTRPASIYWW